jgi:hypothetical protein
MIACYLGGNITENDITTAKALLAGRLACQSKNALQARRRKKQVGQSQSSWQLDSFLPSFLTFRFKFTRQKNKIVIRNQCLTMHWPLGLLIVDVGIIGEYLLKNCYSLKAWTCACNWKSSLFRPYSEWSFNPSSSSSIEQVFAISDSKAVNRGIFYVNRECGACIT